MNIHTWLRGGGVLFYNDIQIDLKLSLFDTTPAQISNTLLERSRKKQNM
jgi:hypothetical protein